MEPKLQLETYENKERSQSITVSLWSQPQPATCYLHCCSVRFTQLTRCCLVRVLFLVIAVSWSSRGRLNRPPLPGTRPIHYTESGVCYSGRTRFDGQHVNANPPLPSLPTIHDCWNREEAASSETLLTSVQVYVETDTSKQIPQLSSLSHERAGEWISPLNVLTVWPLLKI